MCHPLSHQNCYSLVHFLYFHPTLQEKCWCIASWEWVDQPLWSWCTWCCGSVSPWEMLWGASSKNEPFTPTRTSCLSSSSWMSSLHSNGGFVLFSDIPLSLFSHLLHHISHFKTSVPFPCVTLFSHPYRQHLYNNDLLSECVFCS